MNPSTPQRKESTVSLYDLDDEPPPATCMPNTRNSACSTPAVAPLSTPRAVRPRAHPHPPVRGNERSMRFRRLFFPGVSEREWSDWRWQMANRIRGVEALQGMLRLDPAEIEGLISCPTAQPVAITPHYMSLLDPLDSTQPLRRAVIPTLQERISSADEADDPLGEEGQSPLPGLVHRYPDRVLLLATDECSTYCRYCPRSRVVGRRRLHPATERLASALDYIRAETKIRDVVISGGDPLLLGDERLEWLLARLRAIPHVEIVRIGTKTPAVLPQRITPALTRMLRRYHPLWMSLHFMHPDECVAETRRACALLADSGMPLGSQTVLLKNINDDVDTMRALTQSLLQMRVRPYYLYQCDPIRGSAHFRTPVEKGLEIIRGLRGHTTGYAVPTYVIDAPGGGGKIPLMPDAVVARDDDGWSLRNHDRRIYRYPERRS